MALQALLLILIILNAPFAKGCAEDSYAKACSYCQFDAHGKMDQSCYNSKLSEAITCVSTTYPIMTAKYANGKCPALDSCISELQSCVAQYSTTNDKADCQEGMVRLCYVDTDSCIKKSAIKCGEVEQQCCGSEGLIILAALGAFATSRKH